MRNRLYLCAAVLLAGTAAAAAQSTGCAPDPNPSSVNAGCADGLPALSRPLSDSAKGQLDQTTTSSVTDNALPNMPPLEVPGYDPGTDAGNGLSSGSALGGTEGNADISGSTSTNTRIGGSAITGTSGVSSQ